MGGRGEGNIRETRWGKGESNGGGGNAKSNIAVGQNH